MSAKAPGWTSPRPHGRAAERRCLPRLWLNDAVQSQRHFLSGLNFLGSKGSEATSAPIRQHVVCRATAQSLGGAESTEGSQCFHAVRHQNQLCSRVW